MYSAYYDKQNEINRNQVELFYMLIEFPGRPSGETQFCLSFSLSFSLILSLSFFVSVSHFIPLVRDSLGTYHFAHRRLNNYADNKCFGRIDRDRDRYLTITANNEINLCRVWLNKTRYVNDRLPLRLIQIAVNVKDGCSYMKYGDMSSVMIAYQW